LTALQSEPKFKTHFQNPQTEEKTPKYFDTVTKPMNFFTITQRLTRFVNYYKTPYMFAVDIYLICKNFKMFHASNEKYLSIANDLQQKFRRCFMEEFPYIELD
jgi:hypothetical protein